MARCHPTEANVTAATKRKHPMGSAMIRLLTRCAAVAALVSTCTVAGAQPRYGLAPDAYTIFSKWMTSSCIGDEERALREALRRHRAELVPAFRKALADGPPPAELRAVRAAAEARHAELAKFPLREYRVEGVSAQDLARFARVTRDNYVNDQLRRVATGYRSNAVAGLGIVGGPEARRILTQAAARRGDPLALAATEALKTMERE